MEYIQINAEGAENYSSKDMSPESTTRPLNNNTQYGKYVIIAKMIFLEPRWPLFGSTLIGLIIFDYNNERIKLQVMIQVLQQLLLLHNQYFILVLDQLILVLQMIHLLMKNILDNCTLYQINHNKEMYGIVKNVKKYNQLDLLIAHFV
ncbi:unnamed protein product [Paramecium sonneborni]|uniref:Uncharacterized protein n=1 Tax=Paramecium sonneborni TaxID=65129 RepID=A0A8S1QG20_9CILI|nr:unnamed protein product [Paramecium sonneborni]